MKLVHLVGFITKKFVTTHGHMNVKKVEQLIQVHRQIRNVISFVSCAYSGDIPG